VMHEIHREKSTSSSKSLKLFTFQNASTLREKLYTLHENSYPGIHAVPFVPNGRPYFQERRFFGQDFCYKSEEESSPEDSSIFTGFCLVSRCL
jgi:hypothetical protein